LCQSSVPSSISTSTAQHQHASFNLHACNSLATLHLQGRSGQVPLCTLLSPCPVPRAPLGHGPPPQAQCLGGHRPPLFPPPPLLLSILLPLLLGTRAIRKCSPRRPITHRFRRQAGQQSALLSSTANLPCRSPPLWAGAASFVAVPPTNQAGCLLRWRNNVRVLGPWHGRSATSCLWVAHGRSQHCAKCVYKRKILDDVRLKG